MPSKPEFDVGVIGGGPAGSAAAGYLAKAGVRCVVFERELFPRPHVGESFVPATTRVLRDLNFIDQMEEAKFPRKYGAAWTSSAQATYSHDFQDLPSDYNVDVRFEERQQPGVDRNYTYHVDRGLFDMMLLRHAGTLGAEVREGVRVSQVDCVGDPFPVITATTDGKEFRTSVRVVLDATGRHTVLGSQLRLKVTDPVFNQFAIHTWFEDFDRGSGPKADYIFIHFLPVTNSWVWQIPITTTVTSFGVVTQKQNFAKSRASREQFFWDCVGTRPELLEKLRPSRQVRPWKEEGDYSYAMKQICGNGFALIGDAARFVDPIFSSGVSIAMNSARLVSADVIRGLEHGAPFTRESFHEFETTMRRGTNNWYKFITLYYRLNVLFTYFVSNPKHRTQVIQLLQGDLYDEDEPPVLTKMRELAKSVEENENHIWHSLLGTLTANSFRPAF
jgi:1H-pyrrole-2-carbonyl-[peptidyl-carrier protein] chlorinase